MELLHYATKWQAVLLLDEADVFLEKREDAEGHKADRNALVAGAYPPSWHYTHIVADTYFPYAQSS